MRLLSDLYPELFVYALDEQTLIMPYFDQEASPEEMIQEAIRIFIEQHRILLDMCIVKKFKKDQKGKVYCVDPDMAFYI